MTKNRWLNSATTIAGVKRLALDLGITRFVMKDGRVFMYRAHNQTWAIEWEK